MACIDTFKAEQIKRQEEDSSIPTFNLPFSLVIPVTILLRYMDTMKLPILSVVLSLRPQPGKEFIHLFNSKQTNKSRRYGNFLLFIYSFEIGTI